MRVIDYIAIVALAARHDKKQTNRTADQHRYKESVISQSISQSISHSQSISQSIKMIRLILFMKRDWACAGQ